MNYENFTSINGMTEIMAIPLISRFDMLSDTALIFLNTIFPKDVLGDLYFNEKLVEEFKSSFWLRDDDIGFLNNNNKFIEWKYDKTKTKIIKLNLGVLNIMGEITTKLIIIERKLDEKI